MTSNSLHEAWKGREAQPEQFHVIDRHGVRSYPACATLGDIWRENRSVFKVLPDPTPEPESP